MPESDEAKTGPRSMRQFDYFSDTAAPLTGSDLGREHTPMGGLDEHLSAFRREKRKNARSMLVMIFFFGAVTWFVSGYRDWIAYVFSAPRAPRNIGDVTQTVPAKIPHNTYVQLQGITEHRGMQQKLVRGLGIQRKEYWYFRLLGSRGVFIEVDSETNEFGYVEQVDVAGRAVDPDREPAYRQLLAEYTRRYAPRSREALRIVQVGVKPGTGRGPYIVMACIFGALIAMNIYALIRFVRHLRSGPGGMVFRVSSLDASVD